ncbi:hypothetical protein, partial [Ketobacter sp.]
MYWSSHVLNTRAGHVYWAAYLDDRIQRLPINGTVVENLMVDELAAPRALAVDPDQIGDSLPEFAVLGETLRCRVSSPFQTFTATEPCGGS